MVGSFLLGLSLVFYYSAANAIFLTRSGIQKLPYVYIVNGFLVIVFGVGLTLLGRRVTFRTQALILNAVLAATIVVLWAGVRATGSHAVIFVMMAWFRLLFIYTTLSLWELVSRLFDIRQGKRLLPLVGLGVMLASVVGGVLIPVIVAAVGTVNLLLLSAVFLGLFALSLSRILREVNETRREAKRNRREGLRPLVRDRYTRVIFSLKTFSVLTAYLIEYVFYEQAARHFRAQQSLAGFFGTFTAVTTLAMVLVAGLLAGRLIASRGVRGTLFILPLAMLATSLAAAVYGGLAGVGTVFFALVVVTMFTNQVLDKAVDTPTFVLLFQPMPRERRLAARVITEGWLGSVALIVSGVLLLVLTWLHPPNVVPFVALLAVVSAALLLLTRTAMGQYAQALRRATRRGFAIATAPSADGQAGGADGAGGVDGVDGVDGVGGVDGVDALLGRLAPGASYTDQEQARAELRARTPVLDDARLGAAVQVQVHSARSLLAAERDLAGTWPLLAQCLHEELARIQANLFTLLCCSREASGTPLAGLLLDAEARIANGVTDDRANAIEMLDVTLPRWLTQPVLALAEDHAPAQTLRKLGADLVPAPATAGERLALMGDDTSLGSWTRGLVRLGLATATGHDTKAAGMSDHPSPGPYPPEVASVLWLRTVDIFERVPYQVLAELAGRLRPYPVSAGVRVLTEGEDGDELYIVRAGEAAVRRGDRVVARLGPGSLFGELAVLDPAPRSADVVATADTDLLILDRTTLLDLMARRPEVAADVITMLVRRLRAGTTEA